jgi:hypothetical protein
MEDFLRKKGYEIRTEKEMDEKNLYQNVFREEEVTVINCYFNGNKMAEGLGFGYRRLEYCFEQELLKRLLEL